MWTRPKESEQTTQIRSVGDQGETRRDYLFDHLQTFSKCVIYLCFFPHCFRVQSSARFWTDAAKHQTPQHGLEHIGRTVSPELKLLLDEARHSRHLMMITNFILVLVERVRLVHSADRPSQAAEEVDGSYNPASGVCYYFTPSGKQLRKLPHYELNRTCKGRVDDEPAEEERCRKNYPLVSQSGYSHMFL